MKLEISSILTICYILIGSGMLVFAAIKTVHLLRVLIKGKMYKLWRLLLYFIWFFVLGYLGAAVIIWQGWSEFLEVMSGVIFFLGATFVLIVIRLGYSTIKELKAGENERIKVIKELKDKNQELDEFIHVVSHDLKQPLRSVQRLIDMVEEDEGEKLSREGITQLDLSRRVISRADNLLQALLEFATIGKKENKVPVDLNELVVKVKENLFDLIRKNDAVILFKDLPVVFGFKDDITRLFENLIVNSLKFREADIRPEIRICSLKINEFYRICLEDNGIGIPPEDREKIFRSFSTTRGMRNKEGTGLGLAASKKIVESHGGLIWVDDKPEKQGSAFCFTLPHVDHVDENIS